MRKSLVAVGLSVLAWVQSQAQPLFAQAESIESTVANADYVIVGKLEKFGETEKAAEREGHAATIAVEETLKEKYARIESQQRLSVRLPDPLSTLVGWKERGCRLLIAIGDCEPRTVTVIDLTDARLEVLTADFAVLRDPEAVIQAAKETVRRMPRAVRRIHTFELGVPGAALVGTRWASKGTLVLNVPADERLEMRAQEDVRSEDSPMRFQGARALRYFKSDENIALVKPLLADPSYGILFQAQENEGVEVRVYAVRREAYLTLKSWGIDVEMPAIREQVKK